MAIVFELLIIMKLTHITLAPQVLCQDSDGWKMVTIDENKPRGLAPPFFQCILKTAWFHILILILVLANAIVAATMSFDYRLQDPHKDFEGYYYCEVSQSIDLFHQAS